MRYRLQIYRIYKQNAVRSSTPNISHWHCHCYFRNSCQKLRQHLRGWS